MNKHPLPHPFIVKSYVLSRKLRDWTIGMAALGLLKLASLFPANAAIEGTDWLARRLGPLTSRHRLALANLELAFPEKSAGERETIARDMWGNMARLGVEYVFLDQIFDINVDNPAAARVEVEGVEIFAKLVEEKKPFIVFTGHTGNFELLPIGAAAYGLEVTALFRPPNNPYIARQVLSARRTRMGHLVPSRAGAAIALARRLEDNGGVGMLVDQRFQRGPKTTFFGHRVITNPLLGKLARQFECDVYPARCIRLPEGRFRLVIEPAIRLPRAPDGRVDVDATCQILNNKVESWVREYPGQWQWFHDRWGIKHQVKRRK